MAVLTGADNTVLVSRQVFAQIISCLKACRYETGGIVGADKDGCVCAFTFDPIDTPEPYAYRPNTGFLNGVIAGTWQTKGIDFAGFVHSHMHNGILSPQDIAYCRQILQANSCLGEILAGVLDLSDEACRICWFSVGEETVTHLQQHLI